MIIIIKETGELTTPEQLRKTHSNVLFDFTGLDFASQALDEHGMAIVTMPDQPVFDSRLQTIAPVNIAEQDGVYSGEWSEPQMIEGVSRELIEQLIAEKRWLEECSGITYGGVRYDTGRDARAEIRDKFFMAQTNPAYTTNFKSLDGFVELGAADIIGIGMAIHEHVESCFAREAELLETEGATHLDW